MMPLSIAYWLLVFVILITGGWRGFGPNGDRWYFGWSFIAFLLFFIIGLKVFGTPLRG